jgi:mono/diheme cytochrome c family protein
LHFAQVFGSHIFDHVPWEVFMKSSQLRRRLGWLPAVLFVSVVVLAACAPNPNQLIISPQLGEQMVARAAGNQVVRAEPTPLPQLSALTPDQIVAGLPEDLAAAVTAGDAARGEQLALQNGCIGCHGLDPAVTMTGPTWYNIGNTAVGREPGVSPAAYLDHSIVNPGEYLVPNYPDNIMPRNYGEILSVQDQGDLIAYLLSQVQGPVQ